MFVFKIGSRRNVKYRMGSNACLANVNFLFSTQGMKPLEKVPSGDTLNYSFEQLPPAYFGKIRTEMARSLIRQKCFVSSRLLNRYYVVGVDGTELFWFDERHCESCLTRTVKKGPEEVVQYYHPALEAKLLCRNGMVFSLETEFIANAPNQPELSKQDCELKGFYRLEKDLKRDFPQMEICMVLDGLYAGAPTFEVCRKNRWGYLITLKEGSILSLYQEFMDLRHRVAENRFVHEGNGVKREYAWVSEIEYEGHLLNILECVEFKSNEKPTRFLWVTNLAVTAHSCLALAEAARRRWKIENEGFNVQKNGDYELEHAYSLDPVGLKNFYLLLQMGHTINQLMEKGNLLKAPIVSLYGSIRNFTLSLCFSFTKSVFDSEAMKVFLNQPRQIRFNTS